MTDWSSPILSAKLLDACEIIKWILVGVLLLDHLEKLPFDWALLTGRRARRWPQIFYFSAKIFWWVFLVLHILLIKSETRINCAAVAIALESVMAVLNTSCSVLLACRVVAIYPSGTLWHQVIKTTLTIATLGLAGVWLAGSVDLHAAWSPSAGSAWTDGGCVPVLVTRQFSVKFIYIVVYDLFVLMLTIGGVYRIRGSTRIGSILFSQGLLYFAITGAVNLVICVIVILQITPLWSIAGAIPSAAVSTFCATRLYVDLAQVGVSKEPTLEYSNASSKNKSRFNSFVPRKKRSQLQQQSIFTAADTMPVSGEESTEPQSSIPMRTPTPGSPDQKESWDQASSYQYITSSNSLVDRHGRRNEPILFSSLHLPVYPTLSTTSPLRTRDRIPQAHSEILEPFQGQVPDHNQGSYFSRTFTRPQTSSQPRSFLDFTASQSRER